MSKEQYCKALYTWANLMERASSKDFKKSRDIIELAITKSCLLNRMIDNGEQPSQTPCPVHKGKWSGIHIGWPGTFLTSFTTGEKTPVEVSGQCREWYDKGCRCFQHSCGCTTGWQPDEYCGCDMNDSDIFESNAEEHKKEQAG